MSKDVLKRVQLTAALSDSASDSAIRFLAILKSKSAPGFHETPTGTSATAHPWTVRLQKVELTISRCSKECIGQWTITLGLLQNLRLFVLISIRATEGVSTKTGRPYLHLQRPEYGLLLSEYALYSLLLDCLLVNPPSLPPFMTRPLFIL
jgi:hypothetical protein